MPKLPDQVFVTNPPIIARKGLTGFLPASRVNVDDLPRTSIADGSDEHYYLTQPILDFWCYVPIGKSLDWARRQIAKRQLAPNVERVKPTYPDVKIKLDSTRFDKSFESFWKTLGSFYADPAGKTTIGFHDGGLVGEGHPKDEQAAEAVEGKDRMAGEDAWIAFLRDIGMDDNRIAMAMMPTKLRPFQQRFVDSLDPAGAVETILKTLDGKPKSFTDIFADIAAARQRAKARHEERFKSGDKVDVTVSLNGNGGMSVESVTRADPKAEFVKKIDAIVMDVARNVRESGGSRNAIDLANAVGRRVWREAKRHFESDRIRMFNLLVQDSHQAAVKAGWHSDANGKRVERNFGEMIALAHSELSEALEAHRKNLMDDKLPHRHGTVVELIDTIIRCFDTLGMLMALTEEANTLPGIVYVEKREFNDERADHKPENRAKPGGKAY